MHLPLVINRIGDDAAGELVDLQLRSDRRQLCAGLGQFRRVNIGRLPEPLLLRQLFTDTGFVDASAPLLAEVPRPMRAWHVSSRTCGAGVLSDDFLASDRLEVRLLHGRYFARRVDFFQPTHVARRLLAEVGRVS